VLLLLLQGGTMAARRRLAPQAFLLTWLSFSGLAALFSCLCWALQSLLSLSLLPLLPLVIQILACAGVYPALAALFIRAHRGAAAGELA
jgi:rod shape-determining protein MreD